MRVTTGPAVGATGGAEAVAVGEHGPGGAVEAVLRGAVTPRGAGRGVGPDGDADDRARGVGALRWAWHGRCALGSDVTVGVADAFPHPRYGPVRAPVAEAAAARLRARGRPVALLPGATEGGRPVLWQAFVRRDPRVGPVGLAFATPRGDARAALLAREELRAWRRALTPRRVLFPGRERLVPELAAGPSGAPAEAALRAGLARGGTVFVVDPGPAGATFEVRDERVVAVRDAVFDAHAPREAAIAAGAVPLDERRVSYLLAPGAVAEEAARIVRALRERFPRLRGPHPDEWGYAASDRLAALRAVLRGADEAWLLGPVPQVVGEAVRASGVPARALREAADLRPEWLTPRTGSIALLAADDRSAAARAVVSALSGLGPLSVVRHSARTEVESAVLLPAPRPAPHGLPAPAAT
jgi:4-hydroxy-3-methylbut-2-enyl diphosphate reductase